ncbi:MAG: type II toxin-antitoxin system HicB family antitoxin [Euryarchaeota archaeon]|nr:type II toxin-antitoxin system HicB family antitoxin [Euryarchaeota archaeon]
MGNEIQNNYRGGFERWGYNVSYPALPGCHSQGDTIEESLENIKEAIECYLESLEKDNLPISVDIKARVMEVTA